MADSSLVYSEKSKTAAEAAEPDLESSQLSTATDNFGDEEGPANITIIEDEEENGGQPPARSTSKEAEIARQEAAQTANALKKLPDEESPLHWSSAKKV